MRQYACIISDDVKRDKAALLSVAHQFSYSIELLEDGILFDVSGLQNLIGDSNKISQQILGEIKKLQGAHNEAVKLLHNALDLHEQAGARWGMASACNSLGDVARYQGDHEAAEQWYVRAGNLFRAIGSVSATVPEYNRALDLLERGKHAEARPVLAECLAAFTKLGRVSAQADANMARVNASASPSPANTSR